MRKRILTLLLFIMTMTTTMSAYDFMVNGIAYFINSDRNSVSVTYTQYSSSNYSGLSTASIPSTVTYSGNTYSVTSIGRCAFLYCSSLTSVSIPNSVTEICYDAFRSCTNLNSLTIPNSVTLIDGNAFLGCTSLSSVTIPNSVTSIGGSAFDGCSGLTSVNITDLAAWCNIDFYNFCSNPLYYAHNLYLNGSKVTNLVIPSSVTSIGDWAFRGCSGLTSVTIPNSVTSIGSGAFYYCHGLTEVTIPNSVTSIGSSAFDHCTNLRSIYSKILAPENVSYGTSIFFGVNENNCRLWVPNGTSSIYKQTEQWKDFSNIVETSSINGLLYGINENGISASVLRCYLSGNILIPNSITIDANIYSVTSIGEDAFKGCSGLTSVTIPSSVTSIGDRAFEDCTGLTSVNITDLAAWCNIDFYRYNSNPLYYAHNLYLNGSKVTNLVIPSSVTTIKKYTFYNCSGLTSVTISSSVTSIGGSAFSVAVA